MPSALTFETISPQGLTPLGKEMSRFALARWWLVSLEFSRGEY